MLSGQARHIRELIENDPNWTTKFDGQMLHNLAAMNSDLCSKEVQFIGEDGMLKTRRVIDPQYTVPTILYPLLRKHNRVKKCSAMEQNLKFLAGKEGK